MRLVHYIANVPGSVNGFITTGFRHFNCKIGGTGKLSEYGVAVLKRKLSRKHDVDEDAIVVCNVMDLESVPDRHS